MHTLTGETPLSKLCCLPSEKGSTLKEKKQASGKSENEVVTILKIPEKLSSLQNIPYNSYITNISIQWEVSRWPTGYPSWPNQKVPGLNPTHHENMPI